MTRPITPADLETIDQAIKKIVVRRDADLAKMTVPGTIIAYQSLARAVDEARAEIGAVLDRFRIPDNLANTKMVPHAFLDPCTSRSPRGE